MQAHSRRRITQHNTSFYTPTSTSLSYVNRIKMPHVATQQPSLLLQFVLILFHLAILYPYSHSLVTSAIHNASESDRQALLCLRSHLSDPVGALDTWKSESIRFCDWHGVTCSKPRVVALDLESSNITGQISPCIGDLTFLARIHMPSNQINGCIPPEIGRLTRLSYLNLSMNSLTGVIPDTLSSCHNIEIIDLRSNSLEGEIPPSLGQCSHLQKIVLSYNNLQGSIPSGFGLLPSLSELFLTSNNLKGSIPWLLGSSQSLAWVALQNNSLTGEIPPLLVNCSSLYYLALTKNKLNGEIPPALFNSSSIYNIDLSDNEFSGPIPPFSTISSPLKYLVLSGNKLSGAVPASLANFSSLSSLLLAENYLQGTIPESLGRMASLTELDLTYNNLSGTVPQSLYTVTSLTFLSLGANKFVGNIPSSIGHTLPSIHTIILERNQFDGPIPTSLANASSLQKLYLRNNAFTGVIPSLGSLHNLLKLDLGQNKLEAGNWNFLSSLTGCTQLQELYFDSNNLQGILPSSIANLSRNLKQLYLSKNQIEGTIPTKIGNLTNLELLYINTNFLTGNIPDTVGNLRNLYVLSLSQNRFSGEIPQLIGNLKQLGELYFQENNLSGPIPKGLAGCKNLLILNLSCNSFHGSIPRELFSISTLSEGLDLSYNKLTGLIPSEIGSLINLAPLNISNNQLSGEIPSALGNCLHLESLSMEANFLQGSIPGSFNNLRGIIEVDLSQNNLSGEIPSFFESFSSLQFLNLSFNNLEGPIPTGGVFSNSSNLFIQGNKRLCASSPMLQLPPCMASPHKRKRTYIVTIVAPLSTIVLVTFACVAVILLKKRNKAKQPINQLDMQFRKFSYDGIFKATNGLSAANLVGSGRFGLVYRGHFKFEVRPVAIKIFKLDQFGALKNFVAECEVLRNTRHRNLIKVISLCSTFDPIGNEFKALILEYMANGNLESWLHPKVCKHSLKRPLSLGSRITVAVDIAAALDYLHNQCTPPLVHCDLKPSNVLLDDEMDACVSDFGLAKFLYSHTSTGLSNSSSIVGPRGSVGYIAPEYGMGCEISIEGDVYSYGIILLEMITGKRPTDEIFKDGSNLHSLVKLALPQKIGDILEPSLIICHEDEDANCAMGEMQSCVIQLATLGLKCSAVSPKDRPTIQYVHAEMVTIKEKFSALHN